MLKYQTNAVSTDDAPITKDAPTETVLGQMAKNTAARPKNASMTTQMLVVMARMRERRPWRTQNTQTTSVNTRLKKRGTRLMAIASPAGNPRPMPRGTERNQMPTAAATKKPVLEKCSGSVPR